MVGFGTGIPVKSSAANSTVAQSKHAKMLRVCRSMAPIASTAGACDGRCATMRRERRDETARRDLVKFSGKKLHGLR